MLIWDVLINVCFTGEEKSIVTVPKGRVPNGESHSLSLSQFETQVIIKPDTAQFYESFLHIIFCSYLLLIFKPTVLIVTAESDLIWNGFWKWIFDKIQWKIIFSWIVWRAFQQQNWEFFFKYTVHFIILAAEPLLGRKINLFLSLQ